MTEQNVAIVIKGPGEAAIEEVAVPELLPNFILVKVAAIALNPTDWKHIDYLATPNTRVGCDYAGTILAVGSAVTKAFKKGDRVAGFTHGSSASHLEYGCFSTTTIAPADLAIQIPENVSFEEAATLGVGITTVAQGLYQSLGLPLPPAAPASPPTDILIYGGSTATGGLAIQFAVLSGYRVVTTCSPANFEYVKALGAAEAFDYNSESCVEDIQRATGGKLAAAFDCLSGGSSLAISVAALSAENGGVYSGLAPGGEAEAARINAKVIVRSTLAYSALGDEVNLGAFHIPASKEDARFAAEFWELSRGLLADGSLKVHRVAVNEGGSGLVGAMGGLDLLRKGKVSAKKLVYTL